MTNIVAIMTLHQPSTAIFGRLDDVYLLESGRLAFAGSQAATAEHFASLGFKPPPDVNPADFYLDLINLTPQGAAEEMHFTGDADRFTSDTTWSALCPLTSAPAGADGKAASSHIKHATPSELKRLYILCCLLFHAYRRSPMFYIRTFHLVIQVREERCHCFIIAAPMTICRAGECPCFVCASAPRRLCSHHCAEPILSPLLFSSSSSLFSPPPQKQGAVLWDPLLSL